MNKVVPIAANPAAGTALMRMEGLQKIFRQGGRELHVLQNVGLKVEAGEIVALVGPSGSGKSTLLQIAGLLDKPSGGRITLGDRAVENLNDAQRTQLRRDYIGFIYQFHHLQPEFTALENAAMPQIIAGEPVRLAKEKAEGLLVKLGLGERLDHRPGRLSGGEQQRVAIARALANDPKLLFADEPTGNLDPQTSAEVFEMLLDLVHERGIGALVATHNMDLAAQMDRVLELKAGRIVPF